MVLAVPAPRCLVCGRPYWCPWPLGAPGPVGGVGAGRSLAAGGAGGGARCGPVPVVRPAAGAGGAGPLGLSAAPRPPRSFPRL